MTPGQKKRAQQILRRFEQADPMTRQADNAAVDMAALLQELIDAPEAEPVAFQVRNGWASFCVVPLYTAPPAPSVTDGRKMVPDEPTAEMREAGHRAAWQSVPSLFDEDDAANVYRAMLAAAPAAQEPNQSEQHLEMVNAPAPSVPDGWKNAAEWLRNNYQDYPNIVERVLNPGARKVGCTRCEKRWAMHDGTRSFVPWDAELEALYAPGWVLEEKGEMK